MGRTSPRHAFAFALVLVMPAVAAAQPGGTAGAAPPPPTSAAPDGHDTGLLLEVRLDSPRISGTDAGSLPMPQPPGAVFAGYQLRRWSFGVGLELERFTSSTDDTTDIDDTSATTYFFEPGLRVALGHSSDGRAELTAQLDLGFGETRYTYNSDFSVDDVYSRVRVQVGPGLRYWFGRSFALGVAALIRHDESSHGQDFNNTVQVITITDVVTSICAAGVF